MAISNFFIWADIDGKQEHLAGGSMGETGGFTLVIHQRSSGGVVTPVNLMGTCDEQGQLELRVLVDGECLKTIRTER